MIISFSKLSVLAAVCGALAACTPQGQIIGAASASAEQMEQALLACKTQLGFPGQTQTQVTFDGGVPSARVVPFDQITASDAAQINACANGSTTLADGLQVVPMQPTAVTPAAVRTSIGPGQCPRGRSGLYAGTSYCFADLN